MTSDEQKLLDEKLSELEEKSKRLADLETEITKIKAENDTLLKINNKYFQAIAASTTLSMNENEKTSDEISDDDVINAIFNKK